MLVVLRVLVRALELVALLPFRVLFLLLDRVAFSPRLGAIRFIAGAGIVYVFLALMLVYVVAPIRGAVGHLTLADKLHYDAQRWLATAIYDTRGSFVGTFDPRLDSLRDVNFSSEPIDLGSYTANPDHKSIPIRQVPEGYWQCLVYHEDRNIGGLLNPFGIDLPGVLKIPFTTVSRSIAARRPVLGVGGSTLAMHLVRVIYKTPPGAHEDALTKLSRKFREWWLAPVIYRELTAGGSNQLLKEWTANHLWLAQRTGGSPLHGVELASRIVFGKEAPDLSLAEQYVLASAVNRPIILLQGNERLNAVRLDRWRYLTEVRARTCAEKLIKDEAQKQETLFQLIAMGSGPPDPKIKPRLQTALEKYAPDLARTAQANPVVRANALLPAARYGMREEMKQRFGFAWRDHVRGITTNFDAARNLALGDQLRTRLAAIDARYADRIDPGYTLDPGKVTADRHAPGVVVAAANARGEIVRYFELGENAAYFGSPFAREPGSGRYDAAREGRMIASTGKIMAAIAIANTLRDTTATLYPDAHAPAQGLETCARGEAHGSRRAVVAFACSLNDPLLTRTARVGQRRVQRIIDEFGFTMPPLAPDGEGTPASTAVVLGQVAGSPRRVHHMATVVLASLTGRGDRPVASPSLIRSYDFTSGEEPADGMPGIVPDKLIRPAARGLVRALLQAPLCYEAAGKPAGTLKDLAQWCAARRAGLRLHFAKTGTQVTEDADATVDTWVTGGLQFSGGAAYSYVVVVGTGSAAQPWGRKLHAAQVAVPLVDALLLDLEAEANGKPAPDAKAKPSPAQAAKSARITAN